MQVLARQILTQARRFLDDAVGESDNPDGSPNLWPDVELLQHLDEAQMEACLRTRALIDSMTAAVCTIPITAGVSQYALHEAIIVVQRFELRPIDTTRSWTVLRRTNFDELDEHECNWRQRRGRPCAVVQDLDQRMLVLAAVPSEDYTLHLTVWRHPLERQRIMRLGDPTLVRPEHAMALAHWVAYRGFSNMDAETTEPKKMSDHLALFTDTFGERPTVGQIKALATDNGNSVTEHWF